MELNKATHQRSSYKMQLTLFEKYVSNLEEGVNVLNETELSKRLKKIEGLIDLFNDLQHEIEFLSTEDGTEIKINEKERELFTNKFYNVTSRAENILKSVNSNESVTSQGSNNNNFNANIKLPELALPTFNGDFTQWREFYDNFSAVVHNNSGISNAQKLCYLKRSLRNEAADLLCPFSQTDANYPIALKMLTDKYDNQRKIIYSHVQALLEIPIIAKENSKALNVLINTAERHMQCLKSFGILIEHWDALIVPIFTAKLDSNSTRMWQTKINEDITNTDIPKYTDFIAFLKSHYGTLEGLRNQNLIQVNNHPKPNQIAKQHAAKSFASINQNCVHCKDNHYILHCEKFKGLSLNQRRERVQELHLCYNCLNKGHRTPQCKSSSCKICKRRHHTLLHQMANSQNMQTHSSPAELNTQNLETEPPSSTSASAINHKPSQVLLSTAILKVKGPLGTYNARVLLDSASQSNFITEEFCKILGANRQTINTSVYGITGANSISDSQVNVQISSCFMNFNTNLNCLVLNKITPSLPNATFDKSALSIPPNLKLADPTFNIVGKIDILLGASIFWQLICQGQIKLESGCILQKTKLGWIISGNLTTPHNLSQTCSYLTLANLHDKVAQFWDEDEYSQKINHLTVDEKFCENHFRLNTSRDNTGRFIVRMPFKANLDQLGSTYDVALKRFFTLEAKLSKNPEIKSQYSNFMHDYKTSNHMTEISENDISSGYFLPHHCVMRNESTTTKLRVVFEGNQKSNTGLSLNDVQLVGPTIQSDLFSILTRFRMHPYVMTADIAQMYRQVLIHDDDRKYQQIIWRDNTSESLKYYELNTVTYGQAAAPYLAIRCLSELAVESEKTYPLEAIIIKDDFYVDDVLTGAKSINKLKQIRNNLNLILSQGGFSLRKWRSNCDISLNDNDTNDIVSLGHETTKTLGIEWNTSLDRFSYSLKNSEITKSRITKRTILSETAQLFDPLGLLAPIIIISKLLIQELWQLNLNWDDGIPMHLYTKWLTFKTNLNSIRDITIPRFVSHENQKIVELHGFSDASEKAYGACVYVRVITRDNHIISNLLTAKSRVAPLKKSTLPRLELCAAVLLAELMSKVTSIFRTPIDHKYYWCDSTITLCWLKSSPSRWNTYVANRVAEIQRLSNIDYWNHVRSEDNPADIISRGITPSQIIHSKLWWQGASFLTENVLPLNNSLNIPENLLESKTVTVNTVTEQFDIFTQFCKLYKLLNVMSYCYRFMNPNKPFLKFVTPNERVATLNKLIQIAQRESFLNEITALSNNKSLPYNSKLIKLKPFLDEQKILRVGGRLSHSECEYDKKHSILLPKGHHLTTLIAEDVHLKMLHCGPQALLHHIREKYWPIAGRYLTKQICKRCIKCFRSNPKIQNPIMGDFPKERVTINFPFEMCGVDYAGPFLTRDRKGRGYKKYKSYICLFVCFATKAIHLELVSDLTSECFIAALRRFVSRRGKPTRIFSDNGTNFVGANKELKVLFELINSDEILQKISNEGIDWRFIPPRSPHMGGLWEAGVKSMKTHLKRILDNSLLTFEMFYTVLTQIEGVLNSRPLTPLSNDPIDLNPLTPAHFLIGRKLSTIADPDVSHITPNRLSNYQHLQLLVKHFWQRWYKEYLQELQSRTKWSRSSSEINVGDMVIIVDDNTPPNNWRLARVSEIHPGKDNIVRVVSLRTASGFTKRAVNKICKLPIN